MKARAKVRGKEDSVRALKIVHTQVVPRRVPVIDPVVRSLSDVRRANVSIKSFVQAKARGKGKVRERAKVKENVRWLKRPTRDVRPYARQ